MEMRDRIRFWHLIIAFCFFIGLFLLFFLRNHYYEPATLKVDGYFLVDTEINLSWDSGRGFNQSETIPVTLEAGDDERIIELPQLGLKQIKLTSQQPNILNNIESLKVKSASSEQTLSFQKQPNSVLTQIDTKKLEKVNSLLILVQMLLALLLAWLVYEFLGLKNRLGKPNWFGVIKYIFIEEKHWTFWVMFLGAILIFSFWLLGQWPGAPVADTFGQLFQTKTLILNNSHPYLSTLYLLSLMQFYDSFAAVSIFQILATSALASFVFYFVYKNGVKFYLVLPFYLMFVSSIPIGLYNIAIWKDIPFSLLVVFWGFYLFYLGYQQKNGATIEFSLKKIFLLSLLFILMVLIRHNGYLYLLVLPLIIIVGRLMTKRILIEFLLASLVLLLILKFLVPYLFNIQGWSKVETNLAWKFHPMVALIQSESYVSEKPAEDQEIINNIIGYNKIQKYYKPLNGAPLAGEIDIPAFSEDTEKFNLLFYRAMLQNLPFFISERTYLFFTLLYPTSHDATVWWNIYSDPENLRSWISDWGSGTYLYVQFHPVDKLFNLQQKFLAQVYRLNPAIYDLLYPVVFLIIIFFLYKWLPLSARSSFFILAQLPFWFIFIISPSFRYLYFIYLYYFLAFPLLILEITLNRKLAPNSLLTRPKLYTLLLIGIFLAFIIPFVFADSLIIYHWFGGNVKLFLN